MHQALAVCWYCLKSTCWTCWLHQIMTMTSGWWSLEIIYSFYCCFCSLDTMTPQLDQGSINMWIGMHTHIYINYIYIYHIDVCVCVCVIRVVFGGTTCREGVYHLANVHLNALRKVLYARCKYMSFFDVLMLQFWRCMFYYENKGRFHFEFELFDGKHAHLLQVLWFLPFQNCIRSQTCMMLIPKCVKVHNLQYQNSKMSIILTSK